MQIADTHFRSTDREYSLNTVRKLCTKQKKNDDYHRAIKFIYKLKKILHTAQRRNTQNTLPAADACDSGKKLSYYFSM